MPNEAVERHFHLHDYLLGNRITFESDVAVSGNISSEPIRKPTAPMSVKVTETVTSSKLDDGGRTKANAAEIMKPAQPSKLTNVTHQEMLAGFQTQCA
jgi:hypothetical protein